MIDNQSNGAQIAGQSGPRRTIGFVGCHLKDKNSYSTWHGIMDAARGRGVNLISFFPHDLNSAHGFDAQANVLYDLVSGERLDGLIIWSAAFLSYAGPEGAKRVLDHYRPLPIVAIERGAAEDIPWVGVDFYQSMREGVVHLIKEHGFRRIAFIRGPDLTHEAARERYQAYLDVLTEHGLPFDPALVSEPSTGSWEPEVGEAAIKLLLDGRHTSFEAIVAANDYIAIGVMQALQARGISVPNQVAVLGFDDQAESNSTIPSLTTLSLQGYEQGQRANEMLLTLLEGGQIPLRTTLPPKLIIRQSCGCANPMVVRAGTRTPNIAGKVGKTLKSVQQEGIVSEMRQAAGTAIEGLEANWPEQLLEAFFVDLKEEAEGNFIPILDAILQQVIAAGNQVGAWANVISALRHSALPYIRPTLALHRAESLWLQAQVLIGETAQQAQRFQMAQAAQRAKVLDEIRATLMTALDMQALMNALAQELPRLGIPSCYLSLYEDQCQPIKASRLAMAYDEKRKRLEVSDKNQTFPSKYLAPTGILPQDRDDPAASPRSLVVEGLYFQEEQLGFVLFEVGPRDGPLYDILRGEISTALHGAILVRRIKERSAELIRQQYILDAFMENVPDHIYFKDLSSRFTRANKELAIKMGQVDPIQVIGKSDFDFFPVEQARIKYEQEQKIIHTGEPILNLEEPDGIEHWALTTKMPLRDEHGEIIGTFGISRDITPLKKTQSALESAYAEVEKQVEERTAQLRQEIIDRQQAEEEIQRLNAELERRVIERTAQLEGANRELESFSYSVSHDLRSPLRAINGYTRILVEDYEQVLDEEGKRVCQVICKETTRMGKLIDDLLSFSRLGKAEMNFILVDMNALVDEVFRDLSASYPPDRISFSRTNLEEVEADPNLLRQVWANLISNALKYSCNCPVAEIEVGSVCDGNEITYWIRDNGVGFDMQYKHKLFGVFQRLHSPDEFEGTGVGLAIVHRIIQRHGGRVDAISQVGQGATFSFTLPKKRTPSTLI